jgi:predicted component of type VI protein secretion system
MKPSNIEKRLDKIEKILLRNTIDLENHMKRTALLEEEIKILRKNDQSRSTIAGLFDNIFKMLVSLVAILVGLKNLNILKF